VETLLAALARDPRATSGLVPEYVLCFEGRIGAELREAGAPVHTLAPVRFRHPWTVWRARRDLRRLIDSRQPDVVVCHACWPHVIFGPVVRQAQRPLVFWMHDRAGGSHWIDRRASSNPPDLALVNSRATATTLPLLFPQARHEVLYYPIGPPVRNFSTDRAAVRDELQTSRQDLVIVQSSRLERWKGQTLLLDALQRLRDVPGWTAWIAGGPQRPHEQVYLEELRTQARAGGIADRVRFVGQRSDVPRLLAAADIHCQPNTGAEPFGVAFIEALYAGLPVVSTRLGGAAEIVNDSCGRLVEPDDPGALAQALSSLISDSETRARLGAGGPARARELCDPAAALERLENLLRKLCSDSSTKAQTHGNLAVHHA
jgi:glycosyltransferase involved in cell wall biosynthesis